jgi:hypothetical protein
MRHLTADLQPTARDGIITTPSTEKFALFATARADRARASAAHSQHIQQHG